MIPRPASVRPGQGEFRFTADTVLAAAPAPPGTRRAELDLLTAALRQPAERRPDEPQPEQR